MEISVSLATHVYLGGFTFYINYILPLGKNKGPPIDPMAWDRQNNTIYLPLRNQLNRMSRLSQWELNTETVFRDTIHLTEKRTRPIQT